MSARILQVNFKFNLARPEYEEGAASLARAFVEVPGLRWKIWILNEADDEAGGIYFFEDDAALQDYLNGPLAAQVQNHPAFSDMRAKQFEIVPEATAITRGPV